MGVDFRDMRKRYCPTWWLCPKKKKVCCRFCNERDSCPQECVSTDCEPVNFWELLLGEGA